MFNTINKNIIKELEFEQYAKNLKKEPTWIHNPDAEPSEYIWKLQDDNKCRFCGDSSDKICCEELKNFNYPKCTYCKKEKSGCKCVLGNLHSQIKSIWIKGEKSE